MERFFGGLIEHYAGAFPMWLAPIQVVVVPIADRHHGYAAQVLSALKAAGLRAEVDLRNEKVGFKVRWHEVQKVPYMLIVGDREAAGGTVSHGHGPAGDRGSFQLQEFVAEASARARAGG